MSDSADPAPTQKMPRPEPVVLNDRYELREVLGEGGMGKVYRGFDRVLGRVVAVKLLTDVGSTSMIERFEREAQTLSQLNHPNLADVHDFGVAGNQPYIIMEFIEGDSLTRLIAVQKTVSAERALGLIAQIGEGLIAAHDKGVVHRDIKPDNILISQRNGKDWVELVDFGLAASASKAKRENERLTSPGYVVGTQRYMAPEQMEGEDVTAAADIYSFGLVCAELLGGEGCVKAGRLRTTDVCQTRAGRFWTVIERACQEEQADRWKSVREMIDAFRDAGPSSVSQARKLPTQMRRGTVAHRIQRQRQLIVALTIFGILLGLSTIFIAFWREAGPPVVAIHNVKLTWESDEELMVNVTGRVEKARPQRISVEVVVCDERGKRIHSEESLLVDRSLGAMQVLDVERAPQSFLKTFYFHVPKTIARGYASVTFFDHGNLLLAHQDSGLWRERRLK